MEIFNIFLFFIVNLVICVIIPVSNFLPFILVKCHFQERIVFSLLIFLEKNNLIKRKINNQI